jgi:hypothetical protein
MPDYGGPDVMVEQLVAAPDGVNIYHKVTFQVRFSDDFWHRFYAGLAMQGGLAEVLAAGSRAPLVERVVIAKWAHLQAAALVAHKNNTEDDGDGNGTPV